MLAIYRDSPLATVSESAVPPLAQPSKEGAAIAESLLHRLGSEQSTTPNSRQIAAVFDVSVQRVDPPDGYSGPPAYVVAERDSGFTLALVENSLDRVKRRAARRVPEALIESFLILHETAHTFFYTTGPGRRQRLRDHCPAEEEFCDAFALALIEPDVAVSSQLSPSVLKSTKSPQENAKRPESLRTDESRKPK